MAITHFLLQSNFKQTSHSRPFASFSTKWAHTISLKPNYFPTCCIKTSSKLNVKCSFTIINHKPQCHNTFGDNTLKNNATETGIHGMIWRSMDNVIKALKITAVLLGLLFSYDHHLALAASGGRMGGRSFSSRSSARSSSRMSSRTSTRSSSGSSGSRSSSSRPSYSSSTTYITQTSSPAAPVTAANDVEPHAFYCVMVFVVLAVVFSFAFKWFDDPNVAKTSVLKLQVGSLGTGRSLQKDLNRIAESADTSTSKGLHYVLQESILALLRHSDYCISGYSYVDVKKSVEDCEKQFDQLSIEERGKFDEETLVNVDNIKKKSATTQTSNGLSNEYIVVTIIVASCGVLELPPIKSNAQLKEALQKLASIPSSNLMGAEVLWTPQKEDDSLTEQEMLKDYPLLHPL
ncbi:hypothetical protein QVD17_23953 [Tagetes erecta]|uniref:Uncharacterized protein n=1 Tax=Tagetes erecta TaxID=13708 RepID=A0AAD8KH98_TARER|nr:hypothetical protein QVD17_23953 [Tagetes erecta]